MLLQILHELAQGLGEMTIEQEAKKAHINAVEQNYKIELANNEVRAEAKARDAAKLQAFSKTAFDFTGAILKKGAEDRKKAAI